MYMCTCTCTVCLVHVHMYIHVCTLYRVHGLRDPVMVVHILSRAAQCFFTVCLGCTPLLCVEIITYMYIVQAEYGMRVWNDLLYMYINTCTGWCLRSLASAYMNGQSLRQGKATTPEGQSIFPRDKKSCLRQDSNPQHSVYQADTLPTEPPRHAHVHTVSKYMYRHIGPM